MTNLSVFNFESHEVRFVGTADNPWWVAADICKVLELENTSKACSQLDDDQKAITSSNTLGGSQKMLCVNESGLYALIMGSRKPQARAFQKWITSDVIPAIRKTGTYSTKPANSLTLIDTSKLNALVDKESKLQDEVKALETRLASLRNELQNIKRDKAAEAKAFAEKYPDVVKYSIKCNEILAEYGNGNKYFSNPLNR
ncbi:MAG: Bro-N domain-containing protein [Nostoc sp.]|uniref:BRO-N domain-containing protein n=1 Tax=Nostoc sp. TaxID=1180 RepID=UPI002FF048CC